MLKLVKEQEEERQTLLAAGVIPDSVKRLSNYSKTCVKRPLSKRQKIGFQDQLSLYAGHREHSAILSTFIMLPFVMKIFVLPIFEWPLKTGFAVHSNPLLNNSIV